MAGYELPTLDDRMGRPAWQRRAACRGMGPELFFSPEEDLAAAARAVCRICPVAIECRDFGEREPVGIWGGEERRPVKRRRVA